MSAKRRVRFAFRITSGPNAGLGSAGWRVWTHGNSIYMNSVSTGGRWKLSLHGDVAWRYAQTAEDQHSETPTLPAGHERAVWTFTPTPFEDGVRRAFAIAITRAALLPCAVDPKEAVLEVEDRWDRLVTLFLEVTLPGVELTTSRRVIAEPLALSDGRRLWLTLGSEPLDGQPEPQAVSAMIEPVAPETHGVAFPGVMVRGVRIG